MDSPRRKIWFLIGALPVGGTERTLVELANNLDPERFDVTVWTIAEPGPLAEDLDDHVTVRSLDATHKADVTVPVRFLLTLRKEQPDILQSFLFFDNTLATLAGVASPETTVITGVRSVPNDPNQIRSLVRRGTTRLADHIVSNSAAGVEFITSYGADPAKVSVIRNGRDLTVYQNGTAPQDLYDSIGVSPEAPIVGTVGRLITRKGHHDLLEAWPVVLDTHPDAELLLVGDGPERDALAAHAARLGIADSVHFLGTRDDVPALLDALDVFAFPSHFEGLPGAVLEAMAAGLPIVATPVDGTLELLSDGDSGVFVPVQSPSALGRELTELLGDEARARALGESARETAETAFTIEEMVAAFESLYERDS